MWGGFVHVKVRISILKIHHVFVQRHCRKLTMVIPQLRLLLLNRTTIPMRPVKQKQSGSILYITSKRITIFIVNILLNKYIRLTTMMLIQLLIGRPLRRIKIKRGYTAVGVSSFFPSVDCLYRYYLVFGDCFLMRPVISHPDCHFRILPVG